MTDYSGTGNRADQAGITRDKVSKLYSDAAEAYRELWAPELLPLSRDLLPQLRLEEARRVLEVGAGVGALLPDVRGRAPQAAIMAADLSVGMLRLVPPEFPRAAMDASVLALRDGSFDVVIAAFVLFHLFEPEAGIREIARVLRPRGVAGTVTWGDENDPVAYKVWSEELEANGAPPPDPDFVRFDIVDSPGKVEGLMASHGLRHVRSWIGHYVTTPTPEEFIAHRTRHGQSRLRFESMDPEARERCVSTARSRLAALTPADFEETAEVVYVVGEKV